MNIIEPVTIIPAMLIASNVPENDHPAWAHATTYDAGALVIHEHAIYESVQAGNVAHQPDTDSGSWWIRIGATNRWRAFDSGLVDPVTNPISIGYTLSVGRTTDAIALFGMDAATVRVVVTDPVDGVIHDETIGLIDTAPIHDFWTYCFAPFTYSPDLIVRGLPIWAGATVAITITAGAVAKVGEIIVGVDHRIGETLTDTAIGLRDYSVKDRDDWGGAVILERGFTRTVDYRFMFPTEDARRIQQIMSRIRARMAVFYAGSDTDHFATSVPGFYKDFNVPLTTSVSFGTLEVESLL